MELLSISPCRPASCPPGRARRARSLSQFGSGSMQIEPNPILKNVNPERLRTSRTRTFPSSVVDVLRLEPFDTVGGSKTDTKACVPWQSNPIFSGSRSLAEPSPRRKWKRANVNSGMSSTRQRLKRGIRLCARTKTHKTLRSVLSHLSSRVLPVLRILLGDLCSTIYKPTAQITRFRFMCMFGVSPFLFLV